MKYDIAPLAKTVVREVVHAPSKTVETWHGRPGSDVLVKGDAVRSFWDGTPAERTRHAWALAGVHDAFTAHWRTWGGGNR